MNVLSPEEIELNKKRKVLDHLKNTLAMREEKLKIEFSELFILREKVRAEMIEGRNLLKQMAERTKTHIKKAERRLSNLQQAGGTDEIGINERYGLNVSALR